MKESSLPQLLQSRCDGLLSSTALTNKLLRKRSRRSLITSHQIIASSTNYTEPVSALDLSAPDAGRFLLTGRRNGSVALYDLSKWGGEAEGDDKSSWRHSPVAEALRAPPRLPRGIHGVRTGDDPATFHRNSIAPPPGHVGEITSAKWYPQDSGAFLTSSSDGNLIVWDSHEMTPVASFSPFHRYSVAMGSSTIRSDVLPVESMEVSKRACHTVAVACRSDSVVKLVDIRTMGGTHSLTGHDQGVMCLQWSPASEFVLASAGADRCVRLWDVRKAGSRACISVLNQHFVPDSTLSRPGLPHYAHLVQKELCTRNCLSSLPAKVQVATGGDFRHAQTTSSDRPILNLSFDPSGDFLVTHDASLAVWDLRDGQGGSLMPRRFVNAHGSVQLVKKSSGTGHRGGSSMMRAKAPLTVTEDGDGWSIWTASDASIISYSIHGESRPRQQLDGHISTVQALAAASNELLVSAGRDGLILLWGYTGDPTMSPSSERRVRNDMDSW